MTSLTKFAPIRAGFTAYAVDVAGGIGNNAGVPFNSGTGRENPSYVGGHRRESGFFASVRLAASSMAGRAGQPLGWSVPTTGFSPPFRSATHREKWMAEIKPLVGGQTMSMISRVLSRLFSATRHTTAVFPTTAEAIHFARKLVAQGHSVNICANTVRKIGGAA